MLLPLLARVLVLSLVSASITHANATPTTIPLPIPHLTEITLLQVFRSVQGGPLTEPLTCDVATTRALAQLHARIQRERTADHVRRTRHSRPPRDTPHLGCHTPPVPGHRPNRDPSPATPHGPTLNPGGHQRIRVARHPSVNTHGLAVIPAVLSSPIQRRNLRCSHLLSPS